MKYLPLIWAGLWRKRTRTILTFLSVVVAFLLFGLLHGVTAGFDDVVNKMSDTRLRIQSRVNLLQSLPLAYLPRIERVPGVEGVAYYAFFGGYYRDHNNPIAAGAMDLSRLDTMFHDLFVLAPEQLDTVLQTPNGALIGKDLAAKYDWKIGDDVPLKSSLWMRKDGAEAWTFKICGIYKLKDDIEANEFWINYDYFDEARASDNGTVTLYFARIADASRAAQISDAIDRQFVNSAYETQTQNEKAWIRGQVNQVGDIDFFVTAIIGAVLFALLFVTANAMIQSVRERIPELAVLRTYGYGTGAVIGLVLSEATLLCVSAALVGLMVAATVFPAIYGAIGVGGVPLPLNVIALGVVIAMLLALISTLGPALRLQRLSIVDALAGR